MASNELACGFFDSMHSILTILIASMLATQPSPLSYSGIEARRKPRDVA
jgi:hypothetical protein